MSWAALTVVELKKLLHDREVPYSSSDVRKKSQLIDLCKTHLERRDLLQSLQHYGKLSEELARELKTFQNETNHLDSIAASQAAREQFWERQRSERQSIPPVFDGSSARNAPCRNERRNSNGLLRTAGRFSVTSEDGGASPKRDYFTRPSVKSQNSSTPSYRSSSSSSWPTVDPEGRPIRWQIRDPGAFSSTPSVRLEDEKPSHRQSDLGHHQKSPCLPNIVQQQSSPSGESNLQRRINHHPVVTYRWGRIFSATILMVVSMVTYLSKTNMIQPSSILSAMSFPDVLQLFVSPPFCHLNSTTPNVPNCIPCPEHAVCSSGKLVCREPQFREQWRRGTASCVKNTEIYSDAYRLFGTVADFLATQRGAHQCNQKNVDSDGVVISLPGGRESVGFTKCLLINILAAAANPRKSAKFDVAQQVLFEELIHDAQDRQRYAIQVVLRPTESLPKHTTECQDPNQMNEIPVFYSTSERRNLSCVIIETVKSYCISILAGVSIVSVLAISVQRWRYHRTLDKAVRQIIVDYTSVQQPHSSSDPNQKYAIGPKARDIVNILRASSKMKRWSSWGEVSPANSKSYPQYSWLAKYLNESTVEQVCNNLVKSNSSFCRSVLAVDDTPYFYSKKVIDQIRLTKNLSSTEKKFS